MTIFAKVNVELPHHHRVLRIPRAFRAASLGVWLAALCYSREAELDGFCPLEAIDVIASDKVVDQLVAVGLLARDEQDGVHGVRVLRYAEHNETKSEIESRRAYDRKRKGKQVPADRPEEPDGIPKGSLTDSDRNPKKFPDSDSVSESGSGMRLRSSEVYGDPPTHIAITDEVRASCAMAGARDPTPADVVACLANARKKALKRADWSAELVSWMVRGKQHFDRPEPVAPPSRKELQLPPKTVRHG